MRSECLCCVPSARSRRRRYVRMPHRASVLHLFTIHHTFTIYHPHFVTKFGIIALNRNPKFLQELFNIGILTDVCLIFILRF